MISTEIDSIKMEFVTEETLFSPQHADEGTLAMLTEAVSSARGRILDLGCGYGIVGIYLKLRSPDVQVTFSDVSEEAVRCTEDNLKRNGITGCSVIRSNGFWSL